MSRSSKRGELSPRFDERDRGQVGQTAGLPVLSIAPEREKLARYGIKIADGQAQWPRRSAGRPPARCSRAIAASTSWYACPRRCARTATRSGACRSRCPPRRRQAPRPRPRRRAAARTRRAPPSCRLRAAFRAGEYRAGAGAEPDQPRGRKRRVMAPLITASLLTRLLARLILYIAIFRYMLRPTTLQSGPAVPPIHHP